MCYCELILPWEVSSGTNNLADYLQPSYSNCHRPPNRFFYHRSAMQQVPKRPRSLATPGHTSVWALSQPVFHPHQYRDAQRTFMGNIVWVLVYIQLYSPLSFFIHVLSLLAILGCTSSCIIRSSFHEVPSFYCSLPERCIKFMHQTFLHFKRSWLAPVLYKSDLLEPRYDVGQLEAGGGERAPTLMCPAACHTRSHASRSHSFSARCCLAQRLLLGIAEM